MDRNAEFDAHLDECYFVVTIAGVDMLPSNVLFNTDPIAYSVMLSNWESMQEEEDEEETFGSSGIYWDREGVWVAEQEII